MEKSLEAFRAVAPTAVDLAQPVPKPAPPPPVEPKLPPPGKKFVSGLLELVVASPELSEPFGPKAVAREVNRRFRAHLDEPLGVRTASDILRRLAAKGKLQLVREGLPFHEAQYRRKPRKSGSESTSGGGAV